MNAAFQCNLKRRFFFRPYGLPVTESKPKTHNKRLKGDTLRVYPGAPEASVRGLLSSPKLFSAFKRWHFTGVSPR
jgi:hypothetical protein